MAIHHDNSERGDVQTEFTCELSSAFSVSLLTRVLCGDFWIIIPRDERTGVAIAKSSGLLMRPQLNN